jgi:ABC-type transport system involved in multi-copper enzyme maturation permease subunit
MNKIKTIALNTFKESIRNRIIANIFVFAFFLFILGVLIGNWSLGEQVKVITDFGLTALHLVALLIVIFVGVSLVSREIDSRTIYNTLGKSIHRWQFLLGKFFGLSLTLLLNIALLGVILVLILLFYTGELHPGIFLPVLLIYGEMLVVISISIFFSTFNNATVSAIYTIFIFIAGYLFQSVHDYLHSLVLTSSDLELLLTKYLSSGLYWILPHLSLYNITAEFVHGVEISSSYYLYILLYTLFYITFLMAISVIVFNKKDLK